MLCMFRTYIIEFYDLNLNGRKDATIFRADIASVKVKTWPDEIVKCRYRKFKGLERIDAR